MEEEQVLQFVLTTISREADDLGYEQLRAPTADTALFGGEAGIDSLSLVRLIAVVERAAEDRFRRNIVLADERAMSQRSSPFRTVGSLAHLLYDRLREVDV